MPTVIRSISYANKILCRRERVPTVIRSISYPIEYEEKLVELGVDLSRWGAVSQAFRLLIDDAIQRLRAGNPVSVVDAMLSDTSVSEKAGNK